MTPKQIRKEFMRMEADLEWARLVANCGINHFYGWACDGKYVVQGKYFRVGRDQHGLPKRTKALEAALRKVVSP